MTSLDTFVNKSIAWLTLADTDKLVSVKGLVIRATPVIPDMSMGRSHLLS